MTRAEQIAAVLAEHTHGGTIHSRERWTECWCEIRVPWLSHEDADEHEESLRAHVAAALDAALAAQEGERGGAEVAAVVALSTIRDQAAEERVQMQERGEPLTDYSSGVLDGIDKAILAAKRAIRRPEDGRTHTSLEEWWACDDAYEAGHAAALADPAGALAKHDAEMLRAAADEFDLIWNRGHDNSVHPDSHLLRERADRIAGDQS